MALQIFSFRDPRFHFHSFTARRGCIILELEASILTPPPPPPPPPLAQNHPADNIDDAPLDDPDGSWDPGRWQGGIRLP